MRLDISFSKKNKREYQIIKFVEKEDKYLAKLNHVKDNFLDQLQNILLSNIVDLIPF